MSAKTAGALAPIPEKTISALADVSTRAAAAFGQANVGELDVTAALAVAESVEQLRNLLDTPEVQARIGALQDTAIGFRTDSDPKVWNKKKNAYNQPYEWPVVRDCALEAALRGLQWVGNQFNIISGRMYCTKEGFEYLIKRCKAVTEFRPLIQVPRNINGGAIVECSATWKQAGQAVTYSCTIPVKTDDFSGADQIIGKASRKLLKRCFEQMSGISVPDADAEDFAPRAEVGVTPGPRFLAGGRTASGSDSPDSDDQVPGAEVPPVAAKVQAPTPPPVAAKAEALHQPPTSAQEQLADLVTRAGYNFDLFVAWARHERFLEERDEPTCFDDLNAAFAVRMVKAQKGVLAKLALFAANGGVQ